MPLSFKAFTQIDASDLDRLRSNAIPEGLRIDYKQEFYPPSEGKEFLKDVSSFANSHGGYLIVGATEENGLVKALSGVDGERADNEIQRMENWIRDGLEPRVVGIQIRRIELGYEKVAIAISIPKSLNPPHRVSSQNTNRFFVRNSAGKHEASVEELRSLFGFSARLTEEIKRYVEDRRKKIIQGEDSVSDFGGGRLIIHCINAASFRDPTYVDVKKLYGDPYRFAPAASGGMTRRMTLEGILVGSVADGMFWDRVLVNRDGSIELVFSNLQHTPQDQTMVAGLALMEHIVGGVKKALDGLLSLGATGPYVVAIAIETEKGMPVAFYNDLFGRYPKFDRSLVELPLVTLLEYSSADSVGNLLRPALDALWNAAGERECGYFENDEFKLPG